MNLLTAQEMKDLSESVSAASVTSWLNHPITWLLYNSIAAIPPDTASSPCATASEQALAAMGGQRMKDAVLRSIVDPNILSAKPQENTVLDSTYGVKTSKEPTNGK